MADTPSKRTETSAQRAARERNLRKGNPSAYGSTRTAEPAAPPPTTTEASATVPAPLPAGESAPTFRARERKPPAAKRARKRKTPAAAAGASPPAPPAAEASKPSGGAQGDRPGSRGGFLGGLLEGFGL